MSEVIAESGVDEAALAAEPDPLAGGAAAGEATDGAEAVVEAPAEAAAPPFDAAEVQAELEHVRSQNAELQQLLVQVSQQFDQRGNGAAAAQQQQQGVPTAASFVDEYGQFDPVAFAAYQQQRDAQLFAVVQQQSETVAATLAARNAAESEAHYGELVDDLLSDNQSRHGDLSQRALQFVDLRAVQILPELNARFGTNPDGSAKPSVLEMAVERAAGEVRDMLGETATNAQKQQANQLATLAGASPDAGPGVAGGTGGSAAFTSPGDVVRHYAAEARRLSSSTPL